MKKHLLHFFSTAFLVVIAGNAFSQIVGTNCYLQGRYLEIGMNRNASFGACNAQGAIPAGYHPHMSGSGIPPAGSNLAEVYDYGHDGWTVGTPPYMGDYTYPGSPFEGWEIQIGTGRAQAFQNCTGTYSASGVTLAGSITAYSNAGGRAVGTWTGTATGAGGTLAITQETRVDTMSSAVVVTTVMRNTGGAATGPVYYVRSADPDNDQTWTPFSFVTTNVIVHQNEDVRHRVLVTSRGTGYPGDVSYMGLGTRDCRARCFSYSSWPINISQDLGVIWSGGAGTIGAISGLGMSHNSDFGYGLVYNIGAIPVGDSAIISYAYMFNGVMGIDSAFPDPQIVVNGAPKVSWAPPTPNYDTFDACLNPGLTSIPVDILNAIDKDWSWSKWTWSPALGLATTTGVHNIITFSGLPPSITYTITGTDSGTAMNSCHNKTFYLTILTCNNAVANEPCVGDTLKLNAPGDSLGASYIWYSPTGTVVGSAQSVNIVPATLAHIGTFKVIKTVAGIPDTSTVDVNINPLPDPSVTSDQPLCGLKVDPLNLSCATVSPAAVSWTWSGPLGFTSNVQNPTISPFDSAMQGVYVVTVLSADGCKGMDSTLVKPGPQAIFTTVAMPGCPKDSVGVVNTSIDASLYEWSWGDGSKSYDRNPAPHVYNATPSGLAQYSPTLTVTSGNGCTSTAVQTVDLRHTITAAFDFADDTICNTPLENAVINNLSSATKFAGAGTITTNLWTSTDLHTDASATPTPWAFPEEGYYKVHLTVTDDIGCSDSTTRDIRVLQPYLTAILDSSFCLTSPMQLLVSANTEMAPEEYGYTYAWSDPGIELTSDTSRKPIFSGVGDFVYTITATLEHEGCTGSHIMTLHSKMPTPILEMTEDTRINYGESIQLNAGNTLHYMWSPNDGSLSNPNINNPIATPTVTTTYMLVGMDYYGCKDIKYVTVVVDSSAGEFVPSAFTPNGDGLNDLFRLKGSKFHNMVEFRIYNRWGQQVFYTDTKEKGWDGMFNGQQAPMGVYHYIVVVARPGHDHNQVIKGEVTLIR